jgi:hypothetical protein
MQFLMLLRDDRWSGYTYLHGLNACLVSSTAYGDSALSQPSTTGQRKFSQFDVVSVCVNYAQ